MRNQLPKSAFFTRHADIDSKWPRIPHGFSTWFLSLAVSMLLIDTSPAGAASFLIRPDGSGAFPTIQAGIDGAAPNDTLLLSTGTFTGVGNRNLVFGGKSLRVRSASLDPDSVIVDCENAGRALYFKDGEDTTTVVEAITMRNGRVTGTARGAGIACVLGSSPLLVDCRIVACQADGNGGALYSSASAPVLRDCVLAGNRAANGAAVFSEGATAVQLFGTTISDNYATVRGGAMYTSATDTLFVERSIVYGNCAATAGDEVYLSGGTLAVTCSVIEPTGVDGGTPAYLGDNVFTNPLFCGDVDCLDAPSASGDYRLTAGSPALASANACSLLIGAIADTCASLPVGACCFPDGHCEIRTSVSCPGAEYLGDGTSCDPLPCAISVLSDGSGDFPTIQAAVDAAAAGSIVELGHGAFVGAGNRGIELRGKAITVRSVSGDPDSTYLDCEASGRGFYFNDGETPATRIEGIGIRNGRVTGTGRGAGIACVANSSPTLSRLSIRGCEGDADGGALYASSSSPVLEDCLLAGNLAARGGGVFADANAAPILNRSTVAANRATAQGGGVFVSGGSPVSLTRSIVWGNCADGDVEGAEVHIEGTGLGLTTLCSAIDSSGVGGAGTSDFSSTDVFADPLFCSLGACATAPTLSGSFGLAANSPCLAAASPCSLLIGAIAATCDSVGTGACCFEDGSCVLLSESMCGGKGGSYGGNAVPCDPNPCDSSGACCLTDGSCEILTALACATATGTFEGEDTTCDPHPCPPITVAADGSGDYATIQLAINAAGPGAVIELTDGTFLGAGNKNLRFFGKAITLRSASGNPAACRLDMQGSGRGLYFRDGEGPDTIVEDIGIVNGSVLGTARGAGIACIDASPTVRGCVVTGSTTEAEGGGIYVSGGSPRFEGCTVSRNEALRGGGLFLGTGQAALQNTIVYGNCAPDGGEVFFEAGTIVSAACSDVDTLAIAGEGTWQDLGNNLSVAPIFCGPTVCGSGPSSLGDYRLNATSPCLADTNFCETLIGALGAACSDTTGACCYDDICRVLTESECLANDATWNGDGTTCDPDPCPEPGACCLPDDSCAFLTLATCETAGGLYLGAGVECPPTGCSFNAGGVLLTHATPGLSYQEEVNYCGVSLITQCGDGVFSVAGTDTVVFHIIAAFPFNADSRLAGVTFGIDYDPSRFTIVDHGTCGDFELPTPNWPNPGEGVGVTFHTTRTAQFVEVYWFAGVPTDGTPTEFRITEHPNQGAFFADDQIPPRLDAIGCLGSLGLNEDGSTCCATVAAPEAEAPTVLRLHPARPNPFSERTEIAWDLPKESHVRLTVFRADGRLVATLVDEQQAAGRYAEEWTGRDAEGNELGSGIYFVRLEVEGEDSVRKVIAIR